MSDDGLITREFAMDYAKLQVRDAVGTERRIGKRSVNLSFVLGVALGVLATAAAFILR